MMGIIYYLVFLLSGILICAYLFDDFKRHQILVIGLSVGTLLCAWLPAGISLIFGRFDKLTNCIALIIVIVIIGVILFNRRNNQNIIKSFFGKKDIREERIMLICVVPFLIIIAWMFYGHVLLEKSGALYGGQSTYGDLSMHMGMITSIARQGIFPPEYSILPGTKLSYPFLVNSMSSTLYLFNTSLRMSIIIPSIVMSFSCFAGFFILAKKFTRRNKSAIMALLLFFITGGLGVIYFFGDINMFKEIFTGFYKTPVNMPELNLRWVNVICDMMVPQRTTLFGWSVLIPTMFLLYYGMKKKLDEKRISLGILKDNKELIIAGVLAGLMPMVHTHSFLALGILCFGMLLFGMFTNSINKKRYIGAFIVFVIPVIVLASPQLFYWIFTQSKGFVRSNFDWVNSSWPWYKFWIINIGLPFILIIPAFIWGRKKYYIPFMGAMMIYIIAELIVFQPNLYDNNKLLLVWYMIMCIIVGDFIAFIFDKIKIKPIKYITALILAIVLFSSGGLSIIREINSNGQYMLYNSEHVQAAKALDDESFDDAMILTGWQHLNAPAALAGLDIYVGASTYLFFHGFDLSEKEKRATAMFTDETISSDLLASEKIDYVYYSSYEKYYFDFNQKIFSEYPIVFENREATVYAVSDRAIELGELKVDN